jgi:V8-like Glu-specific endopeptidase
LRPALRPELEAAAGSAGPIRKAAPLVLVACVAAVVLMWYAQPRADPTERLALRVAATADSHPSTEAASAQPAAPAPAPSWPASVPTIAPPVAETASEAAAVDARPRVRGDAAGVEDIVATALPAVVLVETSASRGTGFFVDRETVITNAHVIEGSTYVTLVSATGERMPARVTTAAPDQDLAILRLGTPRPGQATLSLARAREVRVGEEVLAIGAPLGFQNTVTRGIVSALRRAGPVTLIQTDAAINPGNSGGPLLDRAGHVIAIATMKVTGNAESLGFGIAADHARALIEGRPPAVAAAASTAEGPSLTEVTRGPDSETSASDDIRGQGDAAYEQAMAELGRRADGLDEYWDRVKSTCLVEKAVKSSGDREWFAVWEPDFPDSPVIPACLDMYRDFLKSADTVRERMVRAEEDARRAGVYPGTRRDLRTRYRLSWSGWDR